MTTLDRRTLLAAAAAAAVLPLGARAATPAIHVAKGTGCDCCVLWTDYLRAEGFEVTEEELYGMQLIVFKQERGVPGPLASCHTGVIEGYFVEGHVPAADIRRLLAERPDAAGIAVPGMPYGSPGMGPETEREAYDVLLVGRDGASRVFTSYPAA